MTYGERNLVRVMNLPEGTTGKEDMIVHWQNEIRMERLVALDDKERKAYEEMGLEYPW